MPAKRLAETATCTEHGTAAFGRPALVDAGARGDRYPRAHG
jgi:hypothetical protein